jgi:hypothetical protein
MKGTLIELPPEGDYEDLIAKLKADLKAAKIEGVVRKKRPRRALVEGMAPEDAATFMYLFSCGYRVVQTDVAGTDDA